MSITYNPTHTLIVIQRKTFNRTTIHIAHPMCLMIGYYNLCPILCMLVHIDVTIFELETNYSCHKLIFINLVKYTLD